ncbi:hypothetical protein V6N12_067802 [Hibiscus sabdariffa]|uniref:Uncharacterized protein n=1 Tax=Hibiscus sabdariffa TaxID=183260 RepID=A0ABR2FNJ8_9ROSI
MGIYIPPVGCLAFTQRLLVQEKEEFLTGSANGKGKIARVSWNRVCQPRSKGGAGVINLLAVKKDLWQLLKEMMKGGKEGNEMTLHLGI